MKIGVIQASSQAEKNELIYSTVVKYAPKDSKVINFGCTPNESNIYSYIDISILVGILLSSGAVDFVVTGCSSGQGMMLACNSMPGVLCCYAPTPKDAYLFAQINNGNAVSLPLGEEYTWTGRENLENTIEALFSEPFGQGYPKSEADRKLKDTELLKTIRKNSQIEMEELLGKLEPSILDRIKKKTDVFQFINANGNKKVLSHNW
ncbi:MAG: RpiB/LacA/LacB family sugar-phosphate isomerase [Lachnospiraceae bacterium]|nr:RpiB/LacA/LacB family sugar-phosphate isomerase [Lachnospiraceae bacterium]